MVNSAEALNNYINHIIFSWSRTLAALGFMLIPCFFILDWFMMPRQWLTTFAVYRLAATVIVFGQYMYLYYTKPSRLPYLHGYFFSLVVGFMIAKMTDDLGGFNSTYYAGLNLVVIAVNLLLPWKMIHSAINSFIILFMYVAINAFSGKPFSEAVLLNNLYFMSATAIIAVSINYVKQKLIVQEFRLRSELKNARDALWGEMEVAKRIQMALLPHKDHIGGYKVAAVMLPAEEVGGDYYDIIETAAGENWISIGDVSGHGVESGLIMMMTQTSIFTTVNRTAGYNPSSVLNIVNSVIKQNITRLGTDRYMTISALCLEHDKLVFAGKHQDILIHRAKKGITEFIPCKGTWLGIMDDIADYLTDSTVPIVEGDVLLLFTDGVTEATNDKGVMFGERNLERAFNKVVHQDVKQIVDSILKEVTNHMSELRDDITLIAIKRTEQL